MSGLCGICLAGPTAAGKTAVALDFARHHAVKVQLHLAIDDAADPFRQAAGFVVLLPDADDLVDRCERRLQPWLGGVAPLPGTVSVHRNSA